MRTKPALKSTGMILLHIALAALLAQSASNVEGIVVQAGSGEPIAGARINLHPERSREPFLPEDRPPAELHEYNATSGRDGKFTLNNVAPGTYRLFATKQNGYVPAEYGQRSATSEGIPFEVTAGRNMTGIQLAMTPTGSISGRVYDRDGEPVGQAQVSALRSIYQDGQRRLTIVQSVQTNDRGEYRLYWLAPGNYYVSAKPEIAELPEDPRSPNSVTTPAERVTAPTRFGSYEQASSAVVRKRTLRSGEVVEETYVPTYYPGVVESPSATAIPVGPGVNASGIDMSVASSIVA